MTALRGVMGDEDQIASSPTLSIDQSFLGGTGAAVSIRIFHLPSALTYTAVQVPDAFSASPLSFLPEIWNFPIAAGVSLSTCHTSSTVESSLLKPALKELA